MFKPEEGSYLWMGNTPVAKIDFSEKESKKEIKKKIELGIWAREKIKEAKEKREGNKIMEELKEEKRNLRKEIKEENHKLMELGKRNKKLQRKNKNLEEKNNLLEGTNIDKLFQEKEKYKEEKEDLKTKLKRLNKKFDMWTTKKNVCYFPNSKTKSQERYEKWRIDNFSKNPQKPNKTKIHSGEDILFGIWQGSNSFLTLTCDSSDRFHLYFDWKGNLFQLSQGNLWEMLKIRNTIYPISSYQAQKRFIDRDEIKTLKKYFRGRRAGFRKRK